MNNLAPKFLVVAALLVPSLTFAQSAGIVVDATDAAVGLYADPGYVHSLRGYRALFDFRTGEISQANVTDITDTLYQPGLRFASPDCTGQAYVRLQTNASSAVGGLVVAANRPYSLYSIAKGAVSTQRAMQSERKTGDFEGECTVDGGSVGTFNVVPAERNEPVETGFPNTPFAPPLRLEVLPISSLFEVFSDGFEKVPLSQFARNMFVPSHYS